MKVLIAEDDKDIASQLADFLKESGFVPRVESDGEEVLFEGEEGNYDAILLDVGLPQMDGFSILEKWRDHGVTTPVIIITARNSKEEVVRGLELGADDYITKPFDLEEVIARLRTNIRRSTRQSGRVVRYKQIQFDMRSGRITAGGKIIKLTRIEFLIVQYLFLHQGETISISEISEHVYEDFDHDSSIIVRHIANIRKKIKLELIVTDSNRGYCIPKEI